MMPLGGERADLWGYSGVQEGIDCSDGSRRTEEMTQFEFISVAVSIVLALSVARLLTAVPHLLATGRRYWVHGLWAAVLLPMHLGFWWNMWAYRQVDAWTFRGFAAVMLTPALLFLTVTILVSDSPGTVESWRERFYSRHRIFFSLLLLAFLSIPLRQFAVLGSPLPSSGIGAPLYFSPPILLVVAIGAFTSKERIHRVLVLIFAATVSVVYATR